LPSVIIFSTAQSVAFRLSPIICVGIATTIEEDKKACFAP